MHRSNNYLANRTFPPLGRSIEGASLGKTLRYLFEQPVFQSPELSIRGIGIRETMPPCLIKRPAGTGDYLFMLFLDSVQFGPSQRSLEAGRIVFWNHDAPHFYGNPKQQWKHSWIHCNGREINSILRAAKVRRGQPLPLTSPSKIEQYLFNLHEEISGFAKPSAIILRNILENFVREAVRREDREDRPMPPARLLRCREQIDSCYEERLTLRRLAEQAELSVPHFCTEFRRHFGLPPITYLIRRRMRVAAELIRGTTGRIGEIGQRVGYDDPYYFSKHFKSFFGMTPSALRRGSSQR